LQEIDLKRPDIADELDYNFVLILMTILTIVCFQVKSVLAYSKKLKTS
jgi:hypothetical protein